MKAFILWLFFQTHPLGIILGVLFILVFCQAWIGLSDYIGGRRRK